MSRVSRSTFRSALSLALVFGVGSSLVACGGDDKPADTAKSSTPVPTVAPEKPLPPVIDSKINVTGEGATAVQSASKKTFSSSAVKSDAKKLVAALDDAGIKATSSASSSGPIAVQSGSTTVIIYPSAQMAATQAASFIRVITVAKTDGRIARYGRAVVTTSTSDKMTGQLEKEFQSIRKVVEKADL